MADPESLRAIYAALLAAFPSRHALAQMLLLQLGRNLNVIAAENADLGETVYQVITWANAENRLPELLQGAAAANPTNAAVQALVAALPPRPPSTIARARTALLPPNPPEPWMPRPESPDLKAALLSGDPTFLAAEG